MNRVIFVTVHDGKRARAPRRVGWLNGQRPRDRRQDEKVVMRLRRLYDPVLGEEVPSRLRKLLRSDGASDS